MILRQFNRYVCRLSLFCLLALLASGCAILQPADPPALKTISQANDAIDASKKAGAADRFPDEFADLERRYLLTRGTFYTCQEDKAMGMAQALIADANALAMKRVEVPKPPPAPEMPPSNQSPMARFRAPSEGEVGTLLTLYATDSSDPDGDKLTYKWDFGDGKMSSFTFPVVTHRYAKVGNYNVRLMVDDGRGGTDTVSHLIRVVSKQVIRSDVLFDIDRATLRPQAEEILAKIAQQMQDNPSYQALLVGHTDSTGTADYNIGLSKRRAEAVRDFLISRGISPERLTTEWKGESAPVAPNTTREGRKQNRRTEITLNPMPALQ